MKTEMAIDCFFEPVKIKNLNLKNRFVMAPMSYYKNIGGVPNDEFVEYHRSRAAGDLGLTITGATGIDRPASNNHPCLANINRDTSDMWRKVVEQAHSVGGPIVLQLWHAGPLFNVAPDWTPAPIESPSGILKPGEIVGKPMTDEQIQDCVETFSASAALAMEIGFDTVEIHAAHGFLIDSFFWDETNRRNDRWGGSTLPERSQFAVEVVRAVRAAIGDQAALLMRVSQWKEQDYDVKLAKNPDELQAWLGPFVDAGVDILDCSQRRFWEPEFDGSDLNFAGWVKKILGVPTITVGSVGLSNDVMTFFEGEKAQRRPLDDLIRRLERGDFDLVAIGRVLMADPEWIMKIRAGREDELRELQMSDLDVGF